jgi:endonuclease YncB( thermonuclease family)
LVTAVNPNQAVTFEICAFGDQPDCVVDGYTIHRNGVKIRLEDIDAPEIGLYQCWRELNLGLKAQMRLLELINAGPFEVVRVGKRDVDQYGRQLRTLYRNGQSLGLMLVSEGLAHRWEGHKHNWCG